MRSLAFLMVIAGSVFVTGELFAEATTQPFVWGIGGHPTWSDYAAWDPEKATTEIGYIRQLGCTYYRCSFEGHPDPSILKLVVPKAQGAGVTILPDLPLKIVAADDAKINYDRNYQTGYTWASYAIAQKFHLPFWELGNELENWHLVKVVDDGTGPDEFPDQTPGGFAAIASSLDGAYHGIKDAYAGARARGETEIIPQILYGACYHHWGLLTKLLKYNGSLPCDIISWHWYEPNCGFFEAPLANPKSFSHGRTPAECLADFKDPSHPGKPMDVWITELNRSENSPQGFLNGSFTYANPADQDWAAEAREIQISIDDLKRAPNVRGIFVYELLDETSADGSNPKRLHSEGYFGLVTGVNGKYKDAFYTYQNEIKENH